MYSHDIIDKEESLKKELKDLQRKYDHILQVTSLQSQDLQRKYDHISRISSLQEETITVLRSKISTLETNMVGVMRSLIAQDETTSRRDESEIRDSEMESVIGNAIKKERKKKVQDTANDSYNIFEDLQYKEIVQKQKILLKIFMTI